MRGLSVLAVLVAIGLTVGCGGSNDEGSARPATTKKAGYVNAIYPQAIAPQRVTCSQFDSQSPKAAALIEEIGKASGETYDHAHVATNDICMTSKASARPYRLAVKRLRAGKYR